MKVFAFISYTFNGLEYPGITYVDSWTKTEVEFNEYLQLVQLHPVTFSTSGQFLFEQLKSSDQFFNGLYMDVIDQRHYMICSFNTK